MRFLLFHFTKILEYAFIIITITSVYIDYDIVNSLFFESSEFMSFLGGVFFLAIIIYSVWRFAFTWKNKKRNFIFVISTFLVDKPYLFISFRNYLIFFLYILQLSFFLLGSATALLITNKVLNDFLIGFVFILIGYIIYNYSIRLCANQLHGGYFYFEWYFKIVKAVEEKYCAWAGLESYYKNYKPIKKGKPQRKKKKKK